MSNIFTNEKSITSRSIKNLRYLAKFGRSEQLHAAFEGIRELTNIFYNSTRFFGLIFRMYPKAIGLIKLTSSEIPLYFP